MAWSSVILALVSATNGFPELLIQHNLFVLGTPMSIYAIPAGIEIYCEFFAPPLKASEIEEIRTH